jgi:hypothetical protein
MEDVEEQQPAAEPQAETPVVVVPPVTAATPVPAPAPTPAPAAPVVPPASPNATELEQLLATAREQARAQALAEVAEQRERERSEAAAAEELRQEEARRESLSELERAKLEAKEAREKEASEKAARERAEAEAATTKTRADLLRTLNDGGLQLQADPAVEDLVIERVQTKLAAEPGKTVAAALGELRLENAWLFRGPGEPVAPTTIGGDPNGRAPTVPKRTPAPKTFNALEATPGEVQARILQLQREQKTVGRR